MCELQDVRFAECSEHEDEHLQICLIVLFVSFEVLVDANLEINGKVMILSMVN